MRISTLLLLTVCGLCFAQATSKAPKAHVLLTPGDMKWMPAPADTGLPPVVQIAVLSGDPGKPGPFAIRLKVPDGGKVPAHWHPTDEQLTVIQGVFKAGMGDKFDAAALKQFPVGSYVLMPAKMHHFAMFQGEGIVQINSTGPFVVNYVNPADDPRKPK